MKQLLGPPFAETIQPGTPSGRDVGGRGGFSSRPFTVCETVRSAWSYLRYPDVQKDLNLAEEQIKALPDLNGRTPAREEEIRQVLTAEQVARLSQVHLQTMQRRMGAAYIFRYCDVAEALKLSDDQKTKLTALVQATTRFAFGGAPQQPTDREDQQKIDEILTDDQEAKLKELLGPRFEGEASAAPHPRSQGSRGIVASSRPETCSACGSSRRT